MRAIVVYESLWGNTEKLARVIAGELGSAVDVTVVDTDAAPTSLEGYDLVVVGGPTHAFSMSRPMTRDNAKTENDTVPPHIPQRGIREWLDALEPVTTPVPAAAFDTRSDSPRLPGSAAKAARHELRSRGFATTTKPKSFHVHGYEGPLIDGDLEDAAKWARSLRALVPAVR
jgi:flavodoxin